MQGTGLFPILIMGAVLLFVLFRRARTLLTRQKIRPTALTGRLALFAVLGAAILLVTLTNVTALLGDLAGLAIGAGVALVGLRLTTFERQPDGLYYTPNRYIGLGVFALFLLRLIYRLATGIETAGTLTATTTRAAAINPFAQFANDPLTTAAYFILIGYYAVYYMMLILRYRQSAAPA